LEEELKEILDALWEFNKDIQKFLLPEAELLQIGISSYKSEAFIPNKDYSVSFFLHIQIIMCGLTQMPIPRS
jgi:hypothetical protein